MPLSVAERKHRMPFGGQLAVAKALGVSKSYVSAVMADRVLALTPAARARLRRAQRAIARKLGQPLDDVFPQTTEEAAPATARAS